jgi:hypothetical protein
MQTIYTWYSVLNLRFNMCVIFMVNYFLVGGDVPIDSETLLLIDFVNLKIKPAESFRVAHRNNVCVHIFIEINNVYNYLHLYYISKILTL